MGLLELLSFLGWMEAIRILDGCLYIALAHLH